MKDEKETLRLTDDSIHVMDGFDPSILDNVTAPVVSIYIPVHHSERDERRDRWDADMQLWLHAGEGLGFLISNTDAYVYNLFFKPEPMVAAGDTYFIKPLLRNFQYGTEYYVLELGNDRFSWCKGDRTHVERMELPQQVHDYFSQLFPNSDESEADLRKDEQGALDFVSLEGHDSDYHDRKSRNEVKQEDAQQWFRYVNKAVDDYLVRDDTTPIILCCDPEYVDYFRKITSLRHLLPVGIEKDPAGLNGKELLEQSLAVMDGIRDENIKGLTERYAADAAHGKASDGWNNIGMALAERRVLALFMTKGKILPGSYDINTGQVNFDLAANPKDDGYIDPAAPDITDAFAKAAMLQDAHIYILDQDQMPTDQPIAALYRYAE